jgi:proteasome assembly chaperone (PAC2) family protein
MRCERIHVHARRLRGIAQSFILRFSIHMKTLESRAEGMERIVVRLDDYRES